jgi:hypothetical protein
MPQKLKLGRGQHTRLIPYEDAVAISINYQVSHPELSHD